MIDLIKTAVSKALSVGGLYGQSTAVPFTIFKKTLGSYNTVTHADPVVTTTSIPVYGFKHPVDVKQADNVVYKGMKFIVSPQEYPLIAEVNVQDTVEYNSVKYIVRDIKHREVGNILVAIEITGAQL